MQKSIEHFDQGMLILDGGSTSQKNQEFIHDEATMNLFDIDSFEMETLVSNTFFQDLSMEVNEKDVLQDIGNVVTNQLPEASNAIESKINDDYKS